MPALAPRRRRHGLIGALNVDFATDASPLPWPEDALSFEDADAFLSALRHAGAEASDHALHALLVHAASGDVRARRLALQAMLGVVARHARTVRNRGHEDAEAVAVTAMLEAISTYPLHLRQRVAANLSMRALSLLPERPAAAEMPTDLVDEIADTHAARRHPQRTRPVDAEAEALIAWGLRQELITSEDADLLRRTHLRNEGASSATLAAELGISPAAFRQRHHRIVTRLAQGVRDTLRDPRSPAAA